MKPKYATLDPGREVKLRFSDNLNQVIFIYHYIARDEHTHQFEAVREQLDINDEAVQLEAVKQNPGYIKYIPVPTLKVRAYVALRNM